MIILFCVSFALYLGGYESGFMAWIEEGIGSGSGMNILIGSLITAFGVGVGTGIVAGPFGGGYSSIYVIPTVVIGTFLASFFLLPISFIFEPTLPLSIKIFLMGILNILIMGTLISFIRGVDF